MRYRMELATPTATDQALPHTVTHNTGITDHTRATCHAGTITPSQGQEVRLLASDEQALVTPDWQLHHSTLGIDQLHFCWTCLL